MSRAPARPSERRGRGLSVEDRAVEWLEARGFSILARNHTCPAGEVDIVAEQGEVIAFVEVRSRAGDALGTPAETIGFGKRRRVVAAATDWAVRNGVWDRRALRFDVLSVIDRGDELEVTHLPAAFDSTGELS